MQNIEDIHFTEISASKYTSTLRPKNPLIEDFYNLIAMRLVSSAL